MLENITAEYYLNIDTNTETEGTTDKTDEFSDNHLKILPRTQVECNPNYYYDILKVIRGFQRFSLIK
jgi:hypothetical protein